MRNFGTELAQALRPDGVAADIIAEVARERQIAQDAIGRLARGSSIDQIETEPLEALYFFIGSELQDRDKR